MNVYKKLQEPLTLKVKIVFAFQVLACAWLNLKECCMVASKLFNAVSKEVVQRAGELIITVLTGTRHKGALEAAAASLADFCSKLLTNVTYEVGGVN